MLPAHPPCLIFSQTFIRFPWKDTFVLCYYHFTCNSIHNICLWHPFCLFDDVFVRINTSFSYNILSCYSLKITSCSNAKGFTANLCITFSKLYLIFLISYQDISISHCFVFIVVSVRILNIFSLNVSFRLVKTYGILSSVNDANYA